MLQEQFYYRLLLIIGFGIIYVKTMMKMAQYRPAEGMNSKNIVMKVLGGLFIILAIFEAAVGVYLTTQIQHPTQMIEFVPNPNQIIRPSSSHVVWGYVTTAQWHVVSQISNAMISLGCGAYFLFYRKSASVWWKKVLKFIFALLLSVFYYSATDFHYFDSWEWLPLILFGIMTYFVEWRMRKPLRKDTIIPKDNFEKLTFEKVNEVVEVPQDDKEDCFMTQEMIPDTEKIKETSKEDDSDAAIDEPLIKDQQEYRYCRYCGKIIDYESARFCKHCGKQID